MIRWRRCRPCPWIDDADGRGCRPEEIPSPRHESWTRCEKYEASGGFRYRDYVTGFRPSPLLHMKLLMITPRAQFTECMTLPPSHICGSPVGTNIYNLRPNGSTVRLHLETKVPPSITEEAPQSSTACSNEYRHLGNARSISTDRIDYSQKSHLYRSPP